MPTDEATEEGESMGEESVDETAHSQSDVPDGGESLFYLYTFFVSSVY